MCPFEIVIVVETFQYFGAIRALLAVSVHLHAKTKSSTNVKRKPAPAPVFHSANVKENTTAIAPVKRNPCAALLWIESRKCSLVAGSCFRFVHFGNPKTKCGRFDAVSNSL